MLLRWKPWTLQAADCLPESCARAQCSIIQPFAELPRARAAPSRAPQYLPIFIKSEETALSVQPLQRARTHPQILSECQFFIWPDGFNRQDPTLSMIRSWFNAKPVFQVPFLIPHPSLQPCYLFWWKRNVSMPSSITWEFSSKNNSPKFWLAFSHLLLIWIKMCDGSVCTWNKAFEETKGH